MAYSTPAMVRQALVASSTGDVPNPPSNTAADLSDAKLQAVVKSCLDQRRDYYDELCERDATQYRFLKGWLNRVDMLEKEVTKWTSATSS